MGNLLPHSRPSDSYPVTATELNEDLIIDAAPEKTEPPPEPYPQKLVRMVREKKEKMKRDEDEEVERVVKHFKKDWDKTTFRQIVNDLSTKENGDDITTPANQLIHPYEHVRNRAHKEIEEWVRGLGFDEVKICVQRMESGNEVMAVRLSGLDKIA